MGILYKNIIFIGLWLTATTLMAQKSEKVKITNLKLVNSPALDFSPALYKKDIVFVSNNAIEGTDKYFDKKIKQQAMSLFISKKDRSGYFHRPKPFDSFFVSHVHEGPVSFDLQNDAIYFTRNDNTQSGKKFKYANDGISYMKIYISYRTSEGWSEPESFPFNDDSSDACHPTLSPDGERLFFASNRKGGFGGMDLYMCKKVNDEWGEPINLGDNVNSPYNEAFPFIHDDGTLYCASDSPNGLGGLDIYYTRADSQGEFKKLEALLSPFNTKQDDFGLVLESDGRTAYLSSNRKGSTGGDDIWMADIPDKTPPFSDVETLSENLKSTKANPNNKLVSLLVIDRQTGNPLSKVFVCTATTGTKTPSVETAGTNCETVITDETGKAVLSLNVNDNYYIRINKTEFKPTQLTVLKDYNRSEIVVLLDKNPDFSQESGSTPLSYTSGKTLNSNTNGDNQVYYLHNIYYDYGDASIRRDARIALDTLATILNNFPDMEIELAAHTDSRGNAPYNMELSKRRANNALDYLLSKGIDKKRVRAIGYGKEQLTNKCRDGVPCPPEKHQENRRTEVRIIKSGGADGKIIKQ